MLVATPIVSPRSDPDGAYYAVIFEGAPPAPAISVVFSLDPDGDSTIWRIDWRG